MNYNIPAIINALEDSNLRFERPRLYLDLVDIVRLYEEYALLLFLPRGDTHHDANKCPYCKENLNGKA